MLAVHFLLVLSTYVTITALSAIVVETPTLIVCRPAIITFSGTVGLTSLTIVPNLPPEFDLSQPPLTDLGAIPSPAKWLAVDLFAGTVVAVRVADATGSEAFSGLTTIQEGTSTSCLRGGVGVGSGATQNITTSAITIQSTTAKTSSTSPTPTPTNTPTHSAVSTSSPKLVTVTASATEDLDTISSISSSSDRASAATSSASLAAILSGSSVASSLPQAIPVVTSIINATAIISPPVAVATPSELSSSDTTSSDSSSKSGSSSTTKAALGITFSILGLLSLIGLGFFLAKRRHSKLQQQTTNSNSNSITDDWAQIEIDRDGDGDGGGHRGMSEVDLGHVEPYNYRHSVTGMSDPPKYRQ